MISMNRDHEPPRLVVVHNYREFGASAVAFATNAGASSRIPIGVLVSPSERGQFPMTIGATFPRRSWDPNLYAFPIMAEFAMTQWQENLRFADPPTDQKAIAAEIVKLIEKAKLRDERAAEILEQSEDPSVYWAAAVMITAGTHPFTLDTDGNRDTDRAARLHALQAEVQPRPPGPALPGPHAARAHTAAPGIPECPCYAIGTDHELLEACESGFRRTGRRHARSTCPSDCREPRGGRAPLSFGYEGQL